MGIRVENGNGAKTRYSLLPPSMMELLRVCVRKSKSRDWLFCARGGKRPLSFKSAQRAYWGARGGYIDAQFSPGPQVTAAMAETILKSLKLDPMLLNSVKVEGTTVLPGMKF